MQALCQAVIQALCTNHTHTYSHITLWICDKNLPKMLLTLRSHRDINDIEDSCHLISTYLSSRPDASFHLHTFSWSQSQLSQQLKATHRDPHPLPSTPADQGKPHTQTSNVECHPKRLLPVTPSLPHHLYTPSRPYTTPRHHSGVPMQQPTNFIHHLLHRNGPLLLRSHIGAAVGSSNPPGLLVVYEVVC
jgi:hypothetical protein